MLCATFSMSLLNSNLPALQILKMSCCFSKWIAISFKDFRMSQINLKLWTVLSSASIWLFYKVKRGPKCHYCHCKCKWISSCLLEKYPSKCVQKAVPCFDGLGACLFAPLEQRKLRLNAEFILASVGSLAASEIINIKCQSNVYYLYF